MLQLTVLCPLCLVDFVWKILPLKILHPLTWLVLPLSVLWPFCLVDFVLVILPLIIHVILYPSPGWHCLGSAGSPGRWSRTSRTPPRACPACGGWCQPQCSIAPPAQSCRPPSGAQREDAPVYRQNISDGYHHDDVKSMSILKQINLKTQLNDLRCYQP